MSPLVVAVLIEYEPSPNLRDLLEQVQPGIEVVWTPYVETEELRSARGRQRGRNTTGLRTPDVDAATLAVWARANVVVGLDLPSGLDELMPELQWIQSVTAGYDWYDLDAFRQQGVRFSNASGLGAASIAEFVMGRVLQIWKNLRVFDAQQDQRQWAGLFGTEATGRTIGIAGLGSIGRQVARRAKAFDMTVLATRSSAKPGDVDDAVDELFPAADLDDMLGRCDVVVSALPSNPTTIDLFDADRFAAMPAGSVFCNVGRGAHVVEADLIAALEAGHLRAAALDVTRVEPLPSDDPLWAAPNLYLSPHTSVSLDRYFQNLEVLVVKNLELLLAGDELLTEIDLTSV